jgi:uncharacterized delta-60 repeat protein
MKIRYGLCLLFSLHLFIVYAQPSALDLSYRPDSISPGGIRTVATQNDGKILVGKTSAIGKYCLYRLSTDGTLDTSFHAKFDGYFTEISSIGIQADQKIIVGGIFNYYDSTVTNHIVRLNHDGSMDSSFNIGSGFNDGVYRIVIQSNGNIIVGGRFTSYNGITCNHLASLLPNGNIDTSFHTAVGATGDVEAIAVQKDGKVVIGGDFDYYGGRWSIRIARVNTDGSADTTFFALPGANKIVTDIAINDDSTIFIVGNFDNYEFQTHNHIAKLNDNGHVDATFNSGNGANAVIWDIELLKNRNILLGGGFSNYNGMLYNGIVQIDNNGALDTLFKSKPGTNNQSVNAIATQPDGKIIIAGQFTSYNDTTRYYCARLYNCFTSKPGPIAGNDTTVCSATLNYSIAPVADATRYQWTLPNGWTGSSDSTSILVNSNGHGGVLSVKAFNDSCGYSEAQTKTIFAKSPPAVALCMVTVDTNSTHNIVIWEKQATSLIDSFFIYRETASNVYSKVGAVPYDSLSIFHDYGADPNVTSYRYKIASLSKCGVESGLSLYHSTIHLQETGNGNFQWTFYQIENALNPVLNFNVYRDNLANGNFFQIGNIPGTNSTYTDLTYNSFTDPIYVVDVNWSIACSPSRTVSTTRSNIKRPKMKPIGMAIPSEEELSIFPNPATNEIFLHFPAAWTVHQIEVSDMLGQVIISDKQTNNSFKHYSTEALPKGIYTVNIETNAGKYLKRLVIE